MRGRGSARCAGGRSVLAAAAGEAKSGHQSSVFRRRLRSGVARVEDTRSASGGVMLEIDPMADWLALFSTLLGGGVAAGVLFYLVGRRVERRTAEAAARAAAVETERLLGGARPRVVLAAEGALVNAREAFAAG